MKIKIFKSDISTDDLENQIAEWTKELNPKIISVNTNSNVMNDYYMDSVPPKICNTWFTYICTMVYEVN